MYKHLHPLIVGREIVDPVKKILENVERYPSTDFKTHFGVVFAKNPELLRLGFDTKRAVEYEEDGKTYYFQKHSMKGNPTVELLGYGEKGKLGHMVTVIKRGDRIEFYNSRGKPIEDIPARGLYEEEADSNTHVHQFRAPVCTRHAVCRAIFSNLSNAEYDAAFKAGMEKYGLSADGLAMAITDKTIEAKTLLEKASPPTSFKKGGLIMAKEAYKTHSSDVGDYKLVKKTPTMALYKKDNEFVVSIRGTSELDDVKADLTLPFNKLNTSGRYKKDLEIIKKWKHEYPSAKWTGVGHSLGGAILDEFIREGLVESGTSYNPAIQPGNIRPENERLHALGDPLYIPFIGSKIVGRRALNPHSLENFIDE